MRKTGYHPWEQALIPCNLAAANCEPKRGEHAKGLSHFLAKSECGRTYQQQKKRSSEKGDPLSRGLKTS